jgi:hemolysin III
MSAEHHRDPPAAASAWTHPRARREEILSAAIQGSAALASAIGLACLVGRSQARFDAAARIGLAVYGTASILAFLASALYHGMPDPRTRRILQRIDHCTIFLLIAGTYTPVALLPLRQHGGVVLLGAIWIVALAGILLRLGNERLYERVAIAVYVLMGWLGLGWGLPLYREIGAATILLMILGALSYTGGLLFYRWHGRPYTNALWHVCVVAGSACFYAAIWRIASP